MALKIIVSYDDSDMDRDALALGRLLAYAGGELALAYVRHSPGRSLEQGQAEELLARGAGSVGLPGMPQHVVNQLNAALAQTLHDPVIRKTLLDRGAEPVGNTPVEHAAFIKSEIEKWRRVAQSAGLKPE